MHNTERTPVWVRLAFTNISTRRGALLLILASLVFTLYCIPWARYLPGPAWLEQLFLVDDWSWFAMMLPITIWYWLGLRWLDQHRRWPNLPE